MAFSTDIPARLDRLPWSRFHWLVIIALGITWILDGLEVTLVGSLSAAIAGSPSLALTDSQTALTASAYLAGAVVGALGFGWAADRFGRKKLFSITVGVYLLATAATGLAWDFWSFALFRFVTGAGIGGEYAAINSAIQELVPARHRGRVDLAVNGSFWLGAALGALGAVAVLDPRLFPPDWGWRFAFILGGVLGFAVLLLRRMLPESPRWLLTHGRPDEAEAIMREIEARSGVAPARDLPRLTLRRRDPGLFDVVRALFVTWRRRAVLCTVLMAAQAFAYNAIFFTYGLILARFFQIPADRIGWFILPFALGNFLGPILLGPLFDSLGRKPMIAGTYTAAGLLMAGTGFLFERELLGPEALTLAWTVIFFFASAAASSAYLTAAESFPLEVRALAISIFYALGTATGGIAGPAVFGALIEAGSRANILWGYLFGAALMLVAAATELILGERLERRGLESVAPPLSSSASP